MTEKPTSVLVYIKRMGKGYFAYSDDLKGFRLFHFDLGTIISEIPEVIKALYKAKGIEVTVQDEAPEDAKDVFPLRYSLKAA